MTPPQAKTPRPEVLAIGGANRDEVMRLAGPLHLGTSHRVSTQAMAGGIARNVAQNLAALGIGTQLLTAVGDDEIGDWLLALTAAAGVDVSPAVKRPEMATGRYIAVLDPDGDLAVGLADMAATESLGQSDIETVSPLIARSEAIFADANLMPQTIAALLEIAADAGVPVTIDLVSPTKARRLDALLPGIDLVVGNRGEAASFLGQDGTAVDLACAIVARGAAAAVISDGAEPLGWCDSANGGQTCGTLVPLPAKVVDVTGAGDALHSGIIAARLGGADIQTASRAGLEVARQVVSSPTHALSQILSKEPPLP